MAMQRILTAAVLTIILLLVAGIWLQSPYQLWIAMTVLGVITGIAFKTGQRHVVTGFGVGIFVTLIREILIYGSGLLEITGPVYAAGYLFAVATTIAVRYLVTRNFVTTKLTSSS